MKKSLLALAVATIAASANAATVYEKDGTSLTLDGRVQSVFYSGNYSKAGENDSSLQNSGRFGIGGKTQITDWVAGIGYAQWDVADGSTRKDKIKLTNKSMSRIIDDLNTIMLTSYKGGYFFDEVCGKYRTYFNALGIEVPEAKHDYKDQVNIADGATDADPDYEAEDSAMTLASGEEI